mgnify:CR=1 FL=1
MLEVLRDGDIIQIEADAGTTVLEVLATEPSLAMTAPCGGRGKCGKCRIRVLEPQSPPTPSEADIRFLPEADRARGVRLACTCPADGVRQVELLGAHARANVKGNLPAFDIQANPPARFAEAGSLAVAVDIGTTTVAAFLVDAISGVPLASESEMNRQSVYGADVLSRISYAENGGLDRLSRAMRAQLQSMIAGLTAAVDRSIHEVGTVAVAGNTTMLHLLAGEDPGGIGRAPFVPRFTELREHGAGEIGLSLAAGAQVILLPSVSAYVGADIVAGAIAADLDTANDTALLVDIGTNGELVLLAGGVPYACSTAAGPAFEGATIHAGVGGIGGAIRSWSRDGDRFRFETIGDEEPVGLCGAGLLQLLASLLDDEVIDVTGRMCRPGDVSDGSWSQGGFYKDRLAIGPSGEPAVSLVGPYLLTQKDVREVQLAKAAIAAGIDTLLSTAGLEPRGLDRVVLTGGFGQHLDIAAAVRLGMLPDVGHERFVTLDDAAGRGAILALRNSWALMRMNEFRQAVHYIELSAHERFQERYIEHMVFPEPGHAPA